MMSKKSQAARAAAQELAYDAMEAGNEKTAAQFCRRALDIYPECADALILLAHIECEMVKDYVEAMRRAVEAGRRDLGEAYFAAFKGTFWSELETRPYMRAMAGLADALQEWGQPDHIDEAICLYEQMLELNPGDNQGIRDPLSGCYLQRQRYGDAARLFKRYKDGGCAVTLWAKVLLSYETEGERKAARLLKQARHQNPHVELYLTGQKRRPRVRPGYYSSGQDTEAIFCADMLWDAWKSHPHARRWLKEQCKPG